MLRDSLIRVTSVHTHSTHMHSTNIPWVPTTCQTLFEVAGIYQEKTDHFCLHRVSNLVILMIPLNKFCFKNGGLSGNMAVLQPINRSPAPLLHICSQLHSKPLSTRHRKCDLSKWTGRAVGHFLPFIRRGKGKFGVKIDTAKSNGQLLTGKPQGHYFPLIFNLTFEFIES